MELRPLGHTGLDVSVIALGTWQLGGGDWGDVPEADAFAVMDAAAESGVNLFDTADVYGDGRSEILVGKWLKANPGSGVTVITKMGRRLPTQADEGYSAVNFRAWLDRSRANLQLHQVPLVQLHCPPTETYARASLYDDLDALVANGTIGAYGVSVQHTAEALEALTHPGVQSIQIILNAFRLKPLDEVVPTAAAQGVAIIARVPLASGLLSGRYTKDTTFAANDHRTFNRHGEAFDVGETFSGVDYETGVKAAAEFAALAPAGATPAQAALAWVASRPGVTTVIPGARSPEQARANAAAAAVVLPDGFDTKVRAIYDEHFRATIHPRW